MGQNNSKRSLENQDTIYKLPQNSKNPFNRIWKPFKPTTAANQTETTDINNNDTTVDINESVLNINFNHKQNTQKSRRSFAPFVMIQATINRLFTSKKGVVQNTNPMSVHNNCPETRSNSNRSTPIIRQTSIEKKSSHDYDIRNNNVFARPMTPEIVGVRNVTALAPNSPTRSVATIPATPATAFPISPTDIFPTMTASNPVMPTFAFPTVSIAAIPPFISSYSSSIKQNPQFKAASDTRIPNKFYGQVFHVQMANTIEKVKSPGSSGNPASTSSSDAPQAKTRTEAESLIDLNNKLELPASESPSSSTSSSATKWAKPSKPKPSPDETRGAKGEPHKNGCCQPKVAPPAYLDYSTRSSSSGRNMGSGRGTGNPIIDRLKNVDVIEELKYFVPGQTAGDCENADLQNDCDYYYACDCCGEMEPAPGCQSQSDSKQGGGKGNPVTYSRRQRFNFLNARKTAEDEDDDDDGPPFKWPGDKPCCCQCCVAGLRRNPNCQCKCCQGKGRARVVNSFDEIPVGKNPEPRPRKECNCDEQEDLEDSRRCEELIPKESGVYFYDAEANRFIRQVPRTPTPVVRPPQPQFSNAQQATQQSCNDDIMEVIQCLPRRRRPQAPPPPIIMPPICSDLNDMSGIMANVELAMVAGGSTLLTCGMPITTKTTGQFPMAFGSNQSHSQSNEASGVGALQSNGTSGFGRSGNGKSNDINGSGGSGPARSNGAVGSEEFGTANSNGTNGPRSPSPIKTPQSPVRSPITSPKPKSDSYTSQAFIPTITSKQTSGQSSSSKSNTPKQGSIEPQKLSGGNNDGSSSGTGSSGSSSGTGVSEEK